MTNVMETCDSVHLGFEGRKSIIGLSDKVRTDRSKTDRSKTEGV